MTGRHSDEGSGAPLRRDQAETTGMRLWPRQWAGSRLGGWQGRSPPGPMAWQEPGFDINAPGPRSFQQEVTRRKQLKGVTCCVTNGVCVCLCEGGGPTCHEEGQ